MRKEKSGQGSPIIREVYKSFDGASGLPELCEKLLSVQKEEWPDLKRTHESLKDVRVRNLTCKEFSVHVQHNPGRAISTLAGVEEDDINRRPCFLCADHLPEAQKGILYRGEYLILCNPAPVFPSHFTIAHIEHGSQAIHAHINTFIKLVADFDGRWTVLYNGPRCGASAPDHLHFQAVPAGCTPIEKEVREKQRSALITQCSGVSVYRLRDLGREVIMLEGDDPAAVAAAFQGYIDTIKKMLSSDREPMMNIAGFYEAQTWRLLIFPRRKHRPDCFFLKGDARIAVSPAVIEMTGVIVTPFERDFERLDAADVEHIYSEVSLITST